MIVFLPSTLRLQPLAGLRRARRGSASREFPGVDADREGGRLDRAVADPDGAVVLDRAAHLALDVMVEARSHSSVWKPIRS